MNYSVEEKRDTPTIPMQKGAFDLSNVWRLKVGAGDSVFNISNGQLWAGSRSYDTGVFKLDLATGALTTTGTINATSGTFSGNVNITSGGVFTFLADDGTTPLAKLYSYVVSSGSGKSVGLDAATVSGEVKLSCGGATRLVAKTIGGKPVIEFWGAQRIFCDDPDLFRIEKAICPTTNGGCSSGTDSRQWDRVHSKNGYNCDGDPGIGDEFDYTDGSGNKRYFKFKGGVLTDEHS
jgi:hypothetical protein